MTNGNSAVAPEEQIKFFSLKIEDLTISLALRMFCQFLGIAYIGEACRLAWDERAPEGRNRGELTELLARYGLQFGMDPIGLGWRPPYWDDRTWLSRIDHDARESKAFSHPVLVQRFGAERNIGRLVRKASKEPVATIRLLQRAFGQRNFSTTRAGMIIPHDWQPSIHTKHTVTVGKHAGPKLDKPVVFYNRQACRGAITNALENREAFPFLGGKKFVDCIAGLAELIQRVGIDKVISALQDATERIPSADTTHGILGLGDEDIANLEISEATASFIHANDINTVCDLLRKKPEELSSLTGFEASMLEEIVKAFSLHKLTLGMDIHMSWF